MTTITIAKNTFWEVLKSPLFVVLAIVGMVAVLLLGMIPYFTLVLEDDVKMFKDVATAMTLFVGLLLAVLSGSKVIDEEIDNKTMLTLLSKPVLRGEIILGKFLGVCTAVAVVVAACGVIIMIFAWLRPPWDKNVDVFSKEAVGLIAKIKDAFHATEPRIAERRVNQWMHFWSVPPMMVLVFWQVAVMTAVSVAISTRLGMALNVVICALIFVAGHMISFLSLDASWAGYLGVSAIMTLIPQLENFNITATLAYRTLGTVACPWSEVWAYVGLAGVCAAMYCAAALLVGMAMFRSRELN
ncbi:MAG: ABC transporter permease subunit [Actinobacteria bacterium]|nr:ABC transporter permease subunit [Actinomycetota bacterium]